MRIMVEDRNGEFQPLSHEKYLIQSRAEAVLEKLGFVRSVHRWGKSKMPIFFNEVLDKFAVIDNGRLYND